MNYLAVLYYIILAIIATYFFYLCMRALQSIISMEKTLKEMLKFNIDQEKKKEEREMRRI